MIILQRLNLFHLKKLNIVNYDKLYLYLNNTASLVLLLQFFLITQTIAIFNLKIIFNRIPNQGVFYYILILAIC